MAATPRYEFKQTSKLRFQGVLSAAVLAMGAGIILFPVLIRAKKSVPAYWCASNLHGIGQAIHLYSADNDERFPAAVDPSDKYVPAIWNAQPARKKLIQKLPLLNVALRPYVSRRSVFKCPEDSGGNVVETSAPNFLPFDCGHSMYDKYGTSYLFRTEIVFQSLTHRGYWPPGGVAILFDGFGHWHGGNAPLALDTGQNGASLLEDSYRYNALFGDMHVRSLSYQEMQGTWGARL